MIGLATHAKVALKSPARSALPIVWVPHRWSDYFALPSWICKTYFGLCSANRPTFFLRFFVDLISERNFECRCHTSFTCPPPFVISHFTKIATESTQEHHKHIFCDRRSRATFAASSTYQVNPHITFRMPFLVPEFFGEATTSGCISWKIPTHYRLQTKRWFDDLVNNLIHSSKTFTWEMFQFTSHFSHTQPYDLQPDRTRSMNWTLRKTRERSSRKAFSSVTRRVFTHIFEATKNHIL